MLIKKNYAIRLRLWINHKRVLAKHSTFYKQADKAHSISATYSLLLLVKRNCENYSLQDLCRLVLINEKHLWNMLPATTNKSYPSQLEKLQQLLTIAKTNK